MRLRWPIARSRCFTAPAQMGEHFPIVHGGETTGVVIGPQNKLTTTRVRAESGATAIRVDPNGTLLKEVVNSQ